jgi:hypothetical protein
MPEGVGFVKRFLTWGMGSLRGHFVLSFVAVTLPLLLIGLIANFRAGYPTADLGMLVFLSIAAAIPPPLFIWYVFTGGRVERRGIRARRGVRRDL